MSRRSERALNEPMANLWLPAAAALAFLLLFFADDAAAKVLADRHGPICPNRPCSDGPAFSDLFNAFWFALGFAAWLRSGWLFHRAGAFASIAEALPIRADEAPLKDPASLPAGSSAAGEPKDAAAAARAAKLVGTVVGLAILAFSATLAATAGVSLGAALAVGIPASALAALAAVKLSASDSSEPGPIFLRRLDLSEAFCWALAAALLFSFMPLPLRV